MPCALLLIISVRKLEDENESNAFLSPYLGRHQANQNVERTEQKIITNKRQNRISALQSRACADVIQLCCLRADRDNMWRYLDGVSAPPAKKKKR